MARDGINRLRVSIAGVDYTLRGDASIEHLHRVAQKVDEVLTQITSANPNLDPKRATVLGAINIADELERLRVQYESLLQLVDEQTAAPSPRSSDIR